jgi:hypothetical protein
MAPDLAKDVPANIGPMRFTAGTISQTRSDYRVTFCSKVIKEATEIQASFKNDAEWNASIFAERVGYACCEIHIALVN